MDGKTADLDSVVATYLTLAGIEGLADIDRRLLRATDVSLGARRAVANALRFHMDEETVIDEARIIASSRLLLRDPKTADYVLRDLTRWEDWGALESVLELQREFGDKRWLKKPIAEYLEACPLTSTLAESR